MSVSRGLSLTVFRLYCSLCLHPDYDYFRGQVEDFLRLPGAVPTTGKQEIDTALKVLQTAREVRKHKDREEIDNGDRDEDMVDEAGRPLALVSTVDNALEILVQNATEEFGFSPP